MLPKILNLLNRINPREAEHSQLNKAEKFYSNTMHPIIGVLVLLSLFMPKKVGAL